MVRAPAAARELTPCARGTLSPPPSCCWCARLCWPRMMWQCHVSPSECRCYRLKGFSLLKRFPLSAGAAGRLLDQSVGDWLEHVGLPQYENKLMASGFDDLHFMVSSSHLLCIVQFNLNSITLSILLFDFSPSSHDVSLVFHHSLPSLIYLTPPSIS